MKFSANLGFLFTDRSLADAIRAAKATGFDAVECHWPYDTPAAVVLEVLAETKLKMLGLNTARGDVAGGENGLSALPGREADAREAIDQAIAYAAVIDAKCVHVMAGFAAGPAAHAAFVSSLQYACAQAAAHQITILIEPLNHYDAPGYFLTTTDQAVSIIGEVAAPNLQLMFDCYHVQLMEGDLYNRLGRLMPWIGHIQFASVPDRGPPDCGEINYDHVFARIRSLGYREPLGAEYKPAKPPQDNFTWMERMRQSKT